MGDKIRITVYKVNLKELFIDFIPSDEFDNIFDRDDIIDGRDFLKKSKTNKKKINRNNKRNKFKNNLEKF